MTSARPDRAVAVKRPTQTRVDVRLLAPALAGWAALALALGAPQPAVLVAAALSLTAGAAGFAALAGRSSRHRHETTGLVLLGLIATGLLLGALAGHRALRSAGPVEELATQRAVVTATATVSGDPILRPARPGVGADQDQVIVTVRLERVCGRGTCADVGSPVLLFADRDWAAVAWGEQIELTVRLEPADPADDVVALGKPRGPPRALAEPPAIARAADHVRARLREASEVLPDQASQLVPSLVVGDTSRLSTQLREDMRVTGLTHLAAVSGANTTYLLTAVLWLGGLAYLPRRWRPVLAVVALAGFVVVARPEPSVLRAAVMGAIAVLGITASRPGAGVPALAGATLTLLATDPWLARSYGFVLSVLATLGLLLFARPWGAALSRRLPRGLRWLGPPLALPLAAQAMCAPVTVLLQPAVSLVGAPANALAEPLVAPATVLGFATAALAAVWLPAGQVLVWGAGIPAYAIAFIAHTAARVPLASVPWPAGAGGAVLLAVVTVAVVVSGPRALVWARGHRWLALAMVLVLLAVAAPVRQVAWPLPGWQLVVCDVGQGDGLVASTGPGTAVLVDVGLEPGLIDGCLRRLGVDTVEAVFLTHYHADHVDGLPGVLAGRRVERVLVPPLGEVPELAERVRAQAAAAGVPVETVRVGQTWSFGDTRWAVLWPSRTIVAGSRPNNTSVVLMAQVAGLRVALLADIEREAAAQVLHALRADPGLGHGVDVVKVAHHGSANRVDGLYAELAAPLALISVGAGNDYGHPAASTVAALQRLGATVVRTDQCGDVAVRPVTPEGRAGPEVADRDIVAVNGWFPVESQAGEPAPPVVEFACRGP